MVECKHYLYPFLKSSVKVNPLKTLHAYILYINFKSTCMYFHIYICLSNSLIHVWCNFDPSWSNSYTTWQKIDMELISLVFTLLNFRSSYVTTVLLFFERGRWSFFFFINHLQELLQHDCIQYVKIARCIWHVSDKI